MPIGWSVGDALSALLSFERFSLRDLGDHETPDVCDVIELIKNLEDIVTELKRAAKSNKVAKTPIVPAAIKSELEAPEPEAPVVDDAKADDLMPKPNEVKKERAKKPKPDPLMAKIDAKLRKDARARSRYPGDTVGERPQRLGFHPSAGVPIYALHDPEDAGRIHQGGLGVTDRVRGGLRLADLERIAKELGIV